MDDPESEHKVACLTIHPQSHPANPQSGIEPSVEHLPIRRLIPTSRPQAMHDGRIVTPVALTIRFNDHEHFLSCRIDGARFTSIVTTVLLGVFVFVGLDLSLGASIPFVAASSASVGSLARWGVPE